MRRGLGAAASGRKDPCGVEPPNVFVKDPVFTDDLHVTEVEEEPLEMFPPNVAFVAYGIQLDRKSQIMYTVIYHAKRMDTLETHLSTLKTSNDYPLLQCITYGNINDWPKTFSDLEKELEKKECKEQKQNVDRALPVAPSDITLHVFPEEAIDVFAYFFRDL